MENLFDKWVANPWLCWGIGAYISVNIGYFSTVLLLEFLLWRSNIFDKDLITYGNNIKTKKTRKEFIHAMHCRVSFSAQIKDSMLNLMGPSALGSVMLLTGLMTYFRPTNNNFSDLPSWNILAMQFCLMTIINDFGLYWGHRIQHMIPYLWKNYHSVHHQLDTPTAVSAVYIHHMDATLQGGLPLVLASTSIRPHPILLYLFVAYRLSENAVNHSGINSWFLNTITCRFLPFRAPIIHHDSHHKFSNYTGFAKNYAEAFWVWDWMFGTYKAL